MTDIITSQNIDLFSLNHPV